MKFLPYLTFHGQANDALKFYQSVFGGHLDIHCAGELFATTDDKIANLVVHGVLAIDEDFHITALDVIPGAPDIQPGATVSMGLHFDDAKQAADIYSRLSENGQRVIDFTPKDWGGLFGIVTDQFGVRWNVDATA
ncbi:VOC family protein [Furfurilactobacillus milii]|uniref:VOC family protein n=1 Tax=Furfurilactobacillus milii TaxID=2888272 RepID=UPI001F1BC284|nr:VOC family protein [Furfurilactobacillus milii]MCF6418492.1 VOC family protein [Furfurilactobacillus milii]